MLYSLETRRLLSRNKFIDEMIELIISPSDKRVEIDSDWVYFPSHGLVLHSKLVSKMPGTEAVKVIITDDGSISGEVVKERKL